MSFCSACGSEMSAGAQFCGNCGSRFASEADPAVATVATSSPSEGTSPGKSRAVAVVMAVFLSFWSFLYTYRSNRWKFWLGLSLSTGFLSLNVIDEALNGGQISARAVWLFDIVNLGVWVWSIIDRSTIAL